jgi:hypothetical protein
LIIRHRDVLRDFVFGLMIAAQLQELLNAARSVDSAKTDCNVNSAGIALRVSVTGVGMGPTSVLACTPAAMESARVSGELALSKSATLDAVRLAFVTERERSSASLVKRMWEAAPPNLPPAGGSEEAHPPSSGAPTGNGFVAQLQMLNFDGAIYARVEVVASPQTFNGQADDVLAEAVLRASAHLNLCLSGSSRGVMASLDCVGVTFEAHSTFFLFSLPELMAGGKRAAATPDLDASDKYATEQAVANELSAQLSALRTGLAGFPSERRRTGLSHSTLRATPRRLPTTFPSSSHALSPILGLFSSERAGAATPRRRCLRTSAPRCARADMGVGMQLDPKLLHGLAERRHALRAPCLYNLSLPIPNPHDSQRSCVAA